MKIPPPPIIPPPKKSLRKIVYHWNENNTHKATPDLIRLAKAGDEIKDEEILAWSRYTASILGYEFVPVEFANPFMNPPQGRKSITINQNTYVLQHNY